MLPTTFSLRRVAVAYIFPANPGLTRDENLAFYDKVSSAGVDVPEFRQQPAEVALYRKSAGNRPNVFEVTVGELQGKFRFLVAEDWPTKSLDLFQENADFAWDAFRQVWALERLGGRPILAETSLRLHASVDGGNATGFLADRCMHIPHAAVGKLGRSVEGVGLQLMIPLELRPGQEDQMPLPGAQCNVRVETLMDDPSKLYFEVVAKWPTMPIPPQVREATGAPEFLNPAPLNPRAYVDATYNFVTQQVAAFLMSAAH